MRYLRRHLGLRYFALLALVAQVWLTFGHVHACEHGHVFGHAHARGHVHTAGRAQPAAGDRARLLARTFLPPADHRPHAPAPHDDNTCVICWAAGIVGSTLVHDLQAIVPPDPDGISPPRLALEIAADHETSAFYARGPP